MITDIRDAVYTRILSKKTAVQYVFNDFVIVKCHVPSDRLEKLNSAHYPGGKLYVAVGAPGDLVGLNRDNTVLREYAVMVGYQKADIDVDDIDSVDTLIEFIEQLETTCRTEMNTEDFSFTRLEYLKDENGTPFEFMGVRNARCFEAYFTVFYNLAVE